MTETAKKGKPYMSSKIVKVLNSINDALKDKSVYAGVKLNSVGETFIKNKMHTSLYNKLTNSYKEIQGCPIESAQKYVEDNLIYGGGKLHSISKIPFLGTEHIPDFYYRFDDKTIAIEIKMGDTGYVIREGLGQSLVFRTYYDYCVCLVVDTSRDKFIRKEYDSNENDKKLITILEKRHNILFTVY